MQIITLGNELLRKKAEKYGKINAETVKLARLMFEILKKDKGVGLAGPQIEVNKRIFVTNISGDMERVFINPSILETSPETIKVEEGCLSIPGIYANVVRYKTIKVQAWNEKGRAFTIEASDILSRVIQHEYDHLEGILFLDRLPEKKREQLIEKYEKKQTRTEK